MEKRWTKIFDGASYSVGKGLVTISTYKNGGHVVALTRLHTTSTFYWTNESGKFRYYTLRKSSNGIYPIYAVSLNKQGWMVISRLRFGIVGESITVRPYTVYTDFADGANTDAIVANLQKHGLNLSPEGDRDNKEMLKNLAETVLFLRKVLAGEADIHQWQRHPYQSATTKTSEPANGAVGKTTVEEVLGAGKSKSKTKTKKAKA